jgi:hypothetical protein
MAQTRPPQAIALPSAGRLSRRAQRQVTMYRVLLERAAEKDLSRLTSEIHDRLVAAIRALATNPRPPSGEGLSKRRRPGPGHQGLRRRPQQRPRPFRWTASADLILGKVKILCNELK